jgi:hypothetical protein
LRAVTILRLFGSLTLTLLAACGGSVGIEGSSVGGACTNNTACASQSRCLTSGDFPGGYCTVNCANHDECPAGTRCIKKENGVCLLQCAEPAECRGGYTCKGKENQSGGGESLICIKD